ncbi:MAG: hypothetical protein LBQ45_00990 [Mycoplasmataceae bacterium]|jgi:hypothetical protein|nr:hypothetical protein [Mycoplasmataceae bacterium]
MAKVKLNIEIDDATYEAFKTKFEQFKKMVPASLNTFTSVEEFIADFLEKMQAFEKSMGSFDMGNIGDMIKNSGVDLNSMFDMFKKDEDKEEEKKEEKKEENLD